LAARRRAQRPVGDPGSSGEVRDAWAAATGAVRVARDFFFSGADACVRVVWGAGFGSGAGSVRPRRLDFSAAGGVTGVTGVAAAAAVAAVAAVVAWAAPVVPVAGLALVVLVGLAGLTGFAGLAGFAAGGAGGGEVATGGAGTGGVVLARRARGAGGGETVVDLSTVDGDAAGASDQPGIVGYWLVGYGFAEYCAAAGYCDAGFGAG
jgi:hypothetical protein